MRKTITYQAEQGKKRECMENGRWFAVTGREAVQGDRIEAEEDGSSQV